MLKSKILRFIFLKETVMLLFGIVFFWFSIGLVVDSNYSIDNLKSHSGTIVRLDSAVTRKKDKLFFKEITKELRLELDSYSNIFTLSTTKNFDFLTSRIKIGDNITVYTKPRLWGIFGLKKKSDINHLTKAEDIIIDYKNYKKSISGLFYFTFLFAIILSIISILKLRKRIWFEFGGYEKYREKLKAE